MRDTLFTAPTTCLGAALLFLAAPPLVADEEDAYPTVSFGGLAFGDAYAIPSHHTVRGDGAQGAVLRRLYLTLDADFSDKWFGRIRTETNQSGEFETYSFDTDIKDLYLGRRVGQHEILFGLSPTPTFDLAESIWGMRYLMRTPMDLQGVASRDTGIAARGPLNDDGSLSYRVMVGTGLEFGAESGDGRKWMAAMTWKPSPAWTLDAYVDFEKLAGPSDRFTGQVFAGYDAEQWRWGAQYSYQDRQQDAPLELASAFIVNQLRDRLSIVGRVDRIMEPSPVGDNIAYLPFDGSAPATMLIGAVEFGITDSLTLTPNIISTYYDRNDDGVRPNRDLHLRLTFFINLE